ncbi:LysR family transcriptional regulator [Streptomyces sp. NPDC050418]|uniref:LysR family transcriptional regulator n=1 Tax=Streptomyces sp. NPDC050418 TaxID=3365612 RepID=UPI003797256B
MELRQLDYFVAVAEERNFTRAAERVHISQSGISAQIRQLERDLGAELFDRSGRTVTLTVAGKAALEHARAAIAAGRAVAQAVDEVSDLVRGHLTVGMVVGCTVTPLFDALAAFHAAHPRVEISVLEDSSDRLTEGVRTGAIDVALIGAAATTPDGLDALTLIDERIVAVIPAEHALAQRSHVTLRDITSHPIICMPEGTGLRAVFDQACAEQDLHPTIALQAGAADAVAALAARGLGIGILSNSMAAAYGDLLTARTIEDADTPALLALIWKGAHNPPVRELLVHCRRAFRMAGPITDR